MINITINSHTAIVLMVLFSMVGPYGFIFLKWGSKDIRKSIFHPIKNYYLLLGLFLIGTSFIFYAFLLKFVEVTLLYPLTSIGYIWTVLLSAKYFKEKITSYKIAGISLIILGMVLIAIGS